MVNCNRGIGLLRDSLDGVLHAVAYLLKNEPEPMTIGEKRLDS